MVHTSMGTSRLLAALIAGAAITLSATGGQAEQQACESCDQCQSGECDQCGPHGFGHFRLNSPLAPLRGLCQGCGLHTPREKPAKTCLPYTDERASDLFYNFYHPATCGNVPAQMYPAPVLTPPLVGHTYSTYQPLMPHEFLYQHHRTYHHYYNHQTALNRTAVMWGGHPIRNAAHTVGQIIRIPR